MSTEPAPFNPDWTIAPSETLREWISQNGLTIRIASVSAADGHVTKDRAALLLAEVMEREPLTAEHADALERATKIPAQTWLNLERGYRADLEAGRKDVSDR